MHEMNILKEKERLELREDVEELHEMNESEMGYKAHYLRALAEIDLLRAEILELRKEIDQYRGEIKLVQEPD